MFKYNLKEDLNIPLKTNFLRTLWQIYISPSREILLRIRINQFIYRKINKQLAVIFNKQLNIKYGVYISLKAHIGKGVVFVHPNNIVIGKGCYIGDRTSIFQGVTLGAKNGDYDSKYPKVEENCIIYSGAKIVGDILVKRNSIVGANSVLSSDTEENSIYAGVPAKKIKKREYF